MKTVLGTYLLITGQSKWQTSITDIWRFLPKQWQHEKAAQIVIKAQEKNPQVSIINNATQSSNINIPPKKPDRTDGF